MVVLKPFLNLSHLLHFVQNVELMRLSVPPRVTQLPTKPFLKDVQLLVLKRPFGLLAEPLAKFLLQPH
jgi:hypothetical protein